MSFLFRGQLSTDKLILQLAYFFIDPFPVWAGINFNSSPNRKLNYENVHKLYSVVWVSSIELHYFEDIVKL